MDATSRAARRDDDEYKELLDRIAAGDEAAMGELYDRAAGRVHELALRLMSDPTDASQAVLDGFLAVWVNAPTYEASAGAASTWIVRTVCGPMRRPPTTDLAPRPHGNRLPLMAGAT